MPAMNTGEALRDVSALEPNSYSLEPLRKCKKLRWSNVSRATVLGAVVVAAGCGGEQRLDVSPVSGRVLYDGKGVPKATVIFHPEGDVAEAAKKLRPFAYADGEGNFQLKTYVAGDGAPLGKYRVSIVAVSVDPTAGPSKDPPAVAESDLSASGPRIPPDVSQKIGNVETAGINVTVHEGENKLEPFHLDQ